MPKNMTLNLSMQGQTSANRAQPGPSCQTQHVRVHVYHAVHAEQTQS